MFEWVRRFETSRPMQTQPRLLMAAGETQNSASYHHEGRTRSRETHCLLKWTREGRGIFRDPTGEHELTPGKAFLCRICDPQTAYYYPPDANRPWRFEYICFAGGSSAEMTAELVHRHGPIFELSPEAPLIRRLAHWRDQPGRDGTLSSGEGAAIVHEALTSLAISRDRPGEDSSAALLTRRAQNRVRSRLHRNLSATELADELGVSREHLSRVFRRQTSQTLYRYIQRQKMLLACHLLKETSLTHKEIAARLGYAAAAHFTRTFRSVMGSTPSRFRRSGAMPVEI